MDGHAPANPVRRSLPGADRVKPDRNLGAAKPPSAKGETNLRPSPAQVAEPPYADPHVRWCGRGGAARLPPIPILHACARYTNQFQTCPDSTLVGWTVGSATSPRAIRTASNATSIGAPTGSTASDIRPVPLTP